MEAVDPRCVSGWDVQDAGFAANPEPGLRGAAPGWECALRWVVKGSRRSVERYLCSA